MQAWLASSLKRFYPGSRPEKRAKLMLEAARGESIAFQALSHSGSENSTGLDIQAKVTRPKGLKIRLRRVGYVPVPHFNSQIPLSELEGRGHIPGLVPDPLFDEDRVKAGPMETNAFWIDVQIPKTAKAGSHKITVSLQAEGHKAAKLELTLKVHPGIVQPRRHFPMTHWFYMDVLMAWYKLEPFDEKFWKTMRAYFKNYAEHGQDTLYVPALVPPLDGVRRPIQLLGVRKKGKRYLFDWTMVQRWVKEGQAAGIKKFEWVHLFTQWGVKQALRVYEGWGLSEKLFWPPETGATSPIYRDFLAQLLPELKRFLDEHDLLKDSFFHISDEPHDEHIQNYRAARRMIADLAPWMKVMDALSNVEFARQGLTDLPIPGTDAVGAFLEAGMDCWTYHCCSQRGRVLNRFMDTPLTKIRMHGWIFYKTRVKGFLHWGYNSWFKFQTRELIDPFTVSDGAAWPVWAYGDTFAVYPGPEGPIDSLRWESFSEGMRDYALLQSAGIDPGDPLLGDIKDYFDFPRSEKWILDRRSKVLKALDRKMRF
jgi:hypothetical protein